MLTYTTELATVTFDGTVPEGFAYPEVGTYDDAIEVKILHHHKDDVDNSVTVRIGEYMVTPEQLEQVLEAVTRYKVSVKAFNKDTE